MRCCGASCASATSLLAGLHGDPVARFNHPALVDRAPAARLARRLAGRARRRPAAPADDAARQRPARQRGRLSGAAGRRRHGGSGAGRATQAIVLAQPCPVQQLPGFAAGRRVGAGRRRPARRAAAASARPACRAGARVLDACAAPGGKTAHLLELADLDVLALDSDAAAPGAGARHAGPAGPAARSCRRRRRRPRGLVGRPAVRRHPARRALQRLGHRAPPPRRALAAPGRATSPRWRARRPGCSTRCGRCCAPGGRLLYCTCSVFKAEGQAQIDAFLQRHGDAAVPARARLPGPSAAAARQ